MSTWTFVQRVDAPNPNGYRFCGRCGAELPVEGCPSCGAAVTDGQRFCGRCGAGLDGTAARSATVAVEERKLATVLFADVVGFTSLAERTDPEVVARLVDTAFRELGDIVAQHGGTVDKYMGDSVMAVFGVPLAHDDDAERAVAAAMAMRHLGGDLVFSIGVNSGEVMAKAVGGGGGVTVIGDTVNVAARLEKAAGPGEVLCGRLTTELTGGTDRLPGAPARPAQGQAGAGRGVGGGVAPARRPAARRAVTAARGPRRRARLPRGAVAPSRPRPADRRSWWCAGTPGRARPG